MAASAVASVLDTQALNPITPLKMTSSTTLQITATTEAHEYRNNFRPSGPRSLSIRSGMVIATDLQAIGEPGRPDDRPSLRGDRRPRRTGRPAGPRTPGSRS